MKKNFYVFPNRRSFLEFVRLTPSVGKWSLPLICTGKTFGGFAKKRPQFDLHLQPQEVASNSQNRRLIKTQQKTTRINSNQASTFIFSAFSNFLVLWVAPRQSIPLGRLRGGRSTQKLGQTKTEVRTGLVNPRTFFIYCCTGLLRTRVE